jgi:O-antigen/teichoic acid export membrane protein
MRKPIVLSAGIVDAGAAAAATFGIQLYAVRILDVDTLGVYGLFWSAFVFASLIAAHLIFRPAQVRSLAWTGIERLSVVWPSVRIGLKASVFGAALVALSELLVPAGTPRDVRIALGITAVAVTIVSPIQDHVRRMFHIAGQSWTAAALSGWQVVSITVAVIALLLADVPEVWVPLGALALANVSSLSLGTILAVRRSRGVDPGEHRFGDLAESGRWLLVAGVSGPGAVFVASALIAQLAGAAALGYAQAARVVARPVLVFGNGLMATVGPSSMEAGATRDVPHANRNFRTMSLLLLVIGGPYLLVAGFDWFVNPLAGFLPVAYELDGLVALAIGAILVESLLLVRRAELIGGRDEKALSAVELTAAGSAVALATGAAVLEAYTLAAAGLLMGAVRAVGYTRRRARMYATPAVLVTATSEAGE